VRTLALTLALASGGDPHVALFMRATGLRLRMHPRASKSSLNSLRWRGQHRSKGRANGSSRVFPMSSLIGLIMH